MKLHVTSCIVLVLSAFITATQSNENETDSNETRRGRVYGRIVKLYSGVKPDPVLCYEEGFKADPTDCSVFYRCVQSFGGKYNVFKFQCGPGTVYDPATEICNHPANTKRSECKGPILPVRHEIHENEIDFQELPSPISTIAPLYLNTKINASAPFTMSTVGLTDTYADIRNSTNNNIPTTTKQQFSEAFGNIGSWSNKYTTSPVPASSTKEPRSDRSDPCTHDGFVGDHYDCKKFYRCVNNFRGGFIRYEFMCGESTVWDDDKQSCNYAWDVRSTRCGRGVDDDNEVSINKEQDISKVTSNYHYATTQNQNPYMVTDNPNINFGDKINNNNNYMTSDPINNSIQNNKITSNYNDATVQYYNENKVTETHPIANYFTENNYNSYNQPTGSQIDYGVTEGHIQVDKVKKDFTTTSSTEHALSTSTRKNDSNKLFNNLCVQSGFAGDPNDCQKFYRCVDSGRGGFTRYDFSCSQGTVWDSSIEACNHAWAVKGCGSKMSTQVLTTESSAMNPSSSMNINESEDNDDNDDSDYGYLNQINQENIKTTTSKVETTFHSPITSKDPNINKACSESGFFKNTGDCKKFYKCVENGRGSFTRFDYNCGEGTVWDETIEACNHEKAVKSCKSSSGKHNDTGVMTTVTLVQTTTQKYIDTDDYDSIYGLEQSMTTPDTATDLTYSTTSKETLSSNKNCSRNGFMGDKENCNKFYRCVDNGHNGYIRYEFSCGDGTVWDPTIEACNHEREVEDCRSSSSNNIDDNNQEPIDSNEDNDNDNDNGYVTPSSKDPDSTIQSTTTYTTTSTTTPIAENDNNNNICKSPGFIGDTENCEKFYRCVDNGNGGFNRIEFSCGEGTVWDSSIEACNHRWAVEKCGRSSTNEYTETTSHSVATSTNDMSDTTTQPSEEVHTSTQQQTHSDDKCTSEGFFGMEQDCKKFYRCVDNGNGGYTKYEFSCGDGTVWDESIQACNHPTSNMTCGKGTQSSTSKPRPDSTSTLSTSSMMSTTPASTASTAHTDAPQHDDKCTSEGFMADSSDCKKFYRCVDNGKGGFTKIEFSCGEGTVWIQEIQACDHDNDETTCNTPKSTTVKISTTIREEPSTSSTHGSTDKEITASISTTTENNYNDKNDTDKCSSEGFYPNKHDCKRFYRCVDDGKGSYTKYEFTCAEGTAWDIQSQSCNYISEVDNCKNNKIPQTETKPDSEDNLETETQENTTVKHNPETVTQENTTIKPLTTTTSTRPNQSTCEEEGFFGDNEDCKKFYRCVSNEKEGFTKYDFTCGDGTIWDQDITACNHPQDVTNPSCRTDGSPSSTSTSTENVSNTDHTSAPLTTSSPSSTLTTTDGASTTTTTKDTNSNCSNSNKDTTNSNNYTCTKAGFYPDPNDCKKFYRCVDWDNNGEKFSIFHFDCGDGTIWDPALETCNYEESVYPPRNCNGTQQQNQNESSSTTDTPSETESTTSTYETTSTSIQPSTLDTEPTTTNTQSTTQLTTQTPSTTQSTTTQKTTTQSKPTTITTTNTTSTTTTTTTQKPTTQSTTTTATTREPSTQQTSTTSSEESTTDSSTQSTTEATVASTTDQTTTNKEPTTSEATTTNSYESTAVTNQMSSTTKQSTATAEGTTATEEISPQTTDSQSTTTDSTTTPGQESTTEGNSSNKDCPDTEDDQYLYVCPTSFKRHPKYCNMFYQCTDDNDNHELKVAVFNCPNNTIYDESKVQCVEENKADKKCNGQISQRKRIKRLGASYDEPVVVSRDSMSCPSAGHFPFEKHEKCSPALLKCEYSRSGKLKGYVYKCPEGFLYWTVSRRCEAIRKLKDCKRSSYAWDKRYDIPVETHNISL